MALPRLVAVAAIAVAGISAAQVKSGSASHKAAKTAAKKRHSAAAVSIDTTQAGGSASLLLEMLRELQQEAESGLHLSAVSTKHCNAVRGHRRSMAEAARRQLSETEAALQRLEAEESRFEGERQLTNSTTAEQERRLAESSSLINAVGSSVAEEKGQLAQAREATDAALNLLRRRAGQTVPEEEEGANLEDSLAQLQRSSQMTETEGNVASSYVQSKSNGDGADSKAQELMQMLVDLRSRLERDQVEADSEHQGMLTKFHAYADRLNTSILRTQSQLATVAMETAQRKTERAYLNGKKRDFSALQKAVDASSAAVESDCNEEENQKQQLRDLIQSESRAVKAMLEQEGSQWLPDATDAAPSLIQTAQSHNSINKAVQQLMELAHKYPEQAALYTDAVQALNTDIENEDTVPSIRQKHSPDLENTLEHIQAFADTDADDKSSASNVESDNSNNKVKDVVSGVLSHVIAKEHAVSRKHSKCGAVLSSAKADRSALESSLKQMNAKVSIVKGAISECEESSRYDLEQQAVIEHQTQQAVNIAKQGNQQRDRLAKLLGDRSKQLVELAAQFKSNGEGDSEVEAPQTQKLLHVLEHHRAALERETVDAPKRQQRVDVADGKLSTLLLETARRGGRRSLRLKSEAALLASLVQSRERAVDAAKVDEESAPENVAAALCEESAPTSKGHAVKALAALQEQEHELRGALANI